MGDLKPQSLWLSNRLIAHRGNIKTVYIIYKVNSTVFRNRKKRVQPSFESRKLNSKGADAIKRQNLIF